MDELQVSARVVVVAPLRFTRFKRFAAYVLSPKIVVGGVLAFVLMQVVEVTKIYRTEQREDVKAVRESVTKLVDAMPPTSVGVLGTTVKVEDLYIVYTSAPARDYLAGVVGQLSVRKAGYVDAERKSAAAVESARTSAEEERRSREAARLAAEAKGINAAESARLDLEAAARAEAAEKALLIAKKEAAEAEAAKQRNIAEARRWQRALDRAPR